MKRSVLGMLAHVDAGKTTLSEALLFTAGNLRTLGRVDHGDAFLDTFDMERRRGITIFSKQALLSLPDTRFTLLDTPGHTDFAAEMERTLAVLDAAVLVISGTDGVQSHTITVWKLLRKRQIPTFLFVNKMDLAGADKAAVLASLQKDLGGGFFDAGARDPELAAECDEALLEEFLESGRLEEESLRKAIAGCRIFPCWFGSALKLQGIEEFLDALVRFVPSCDSGEKGFGARVFKISRDEQGNRLTHLKVTSGRLKVRDTLTTQAGEEKVTQLRVYSGARFTPAEFLLPGDVAAVAGLSRSYPGQGLGLARDGRDTLLEPVLNYRVLLPQGADPVKALAVFRQLEEEEPQLHVDWSEQLREIRVRLMGPVQLEILHQQLLDRFGLEVSFGPGSIQYRETIAAPVEGVGHYEPLRHYAEVHLLMEPAAPGSGLVLDTQCPEDQLDRNWQRLILTHLAEKQHLGVLTGSPLTDVTITLMAGKAHLKHTEGGDFRQATYRAVRQGLMQAESVLLEPWYAFTLTLPEAHVGRAMTDLNQFGASFELAREGDYASLTGSAPVAKLQNYGAELAAYTHGSGRLSLVPDGYRPCTEADAVVEALGYQPEADLANTPDSVFCSHGAGYNVPWHQVPDHMHLPSVLAEPEPEDINQVLARRYVEMQATDEELRRIFERTYGPIKRKANQAMRPAPKSAPAKPYKGKPLKTGPEYVLVDGYNIIHAWEELRTLMDKSLDNARAELLQLLRNYQGFKQNKVILVFDAYKVKGGSGSVEHYGDVSVVYTKEAETADMYIEKVSSDLAKDYRVRVATSDGLEQIIVLSHGCLRVSAAQFREEVLATDRAIREYLSRQ